MKLPGRNPSCPYEVEVLFRVVLTVHIDADYENTNNWFDALFKANAAKRYSNVSLETTGGGPCWAAYVTIRGTNLNRVKAFADRAVNLARTKRVRLET